MELSAGLSWAGVGSLFGIYIGYYILLGLYNVSPLHPLSKFPGPKLAAASYIYEAYYDWIRGGRYGLEIKKMHEKHGPIVRISPDELHCDDPHFTEEIYAHSGRIRDKWQHQLNTSGAGPISKTGFATVPHELHKSRRAVFSKHFSRQQVQKLEGEVLNLANLTVDKILKNRGEVFNIKDAFGCFTADVVSQYAFGEAMGFVSQEKWEPNFANWVDSFLKSAYTLRHNAFVRKLSDALPLLANYMGEDIRTLFEFTNVTIPGYVKKAMADPDNARVFGEVIKAKIPEEEKSLYRLSGEGFNFLVAGTETTAATLTVIAYHLFANKKIYNRLMDELDGVEIKWHELEKRPYLWAIIHESLRMMPGVAGRSARVARDEDLVYKSHDGRGFEWVIPKGTAIGMTSMISHWNTEFFPNPDEYLPERWILPNGQPDHQLTKKLLAFSRGSRSCLGENLAFSEIFIMTALVAKRVVPRAELRDTTIEDITYDHDMVIVQTKKGPISVKIVVT